MMKKLHYKQICEKENGEVSNHYEAVVLSRSISPEEVLAKWNRIGKSMANQKTPGISNIKWSYESSFQ